MLFSSCLYHVELGSTESSLKSSDNSGMTMVVAPPCELPTGSRRNELTLQFEKA